MYITWDKDVYKIVGGIFCLGVALYIMNYTASIRATLASEGTTTAGPMGWFVLYLHWIFIVMGVLNLTSGIYGLKKRSQSAKNKEAVSSDYNPFPGYRNPYQSKTNSRPQKMTVAEALMKGYTFEVSGGSKPQINNTANHPSKLQSQVNDQVDDEWDWDKNFSN